MQRLDGSVLAQVLFVGLTESGEIELHCSIPGDAELAMSAVGTSVIMKIDETRRNTNALLHSAGHLIDAAVARIGLAAALKPGKGYHFTDNPNVEYEIMQADCELLKDLDGLSSKLNETFLALVEEGIPTNKSFLTKAEAAAIMDDPLIG